MSSASYQIPKESQSTAGRRYPKPIRSKRAGIIAPIGASLSNYPMPGTRARYCATLAPCASARAGSSRSTCHPGTARHLSASKETATLTRAHYPSNPGSWPCLPTPIGGFPLNPKPRIGEGSQLKPKPRNQSSGALTKRVAKAVFCKRRRVCAQLAGARRLTISGGND